MRTKRAAILKRNMNKFLPFLLILVLAGGARAHGEELDNTPHLPLPRFATLRSDEANMRTGPGTRYPIEWVYTHKGLPVEVVAEYDIWRRVRDSDGTEGWFHKTELTGKRSVIVTGAIRELRNSHDDQGAVIAHLQPGAIGQLTSCSKDWCKLKFDGIKGYLRKTDFWGAYANEIFD
jgi:SH3-like domain-containing protein